MLGGGIGAATDPAPVSFWQPERSRDLRAEMAVKASRAPSCKPSQLRRLRWLSRDSLDKPGIGAPRRLTMLRQPCRLRSRSPVKPASFVKL